MDPSEPSLDDVCREYPRWHCWQGTNHLYYARLANTSPPVSVRGESPIDLRDEIRRWEGTHEQ
jgi:hypothetical protein